MGRLFTPKGTVLIPAESKSFWQIRGEKINFKPLSLWKEVFLREKNL